MGGSLENLSPPAPFCHMLTKLRQGLFWPQLAMPMSSVKLCMDYHSTYRNPTEPRDKIRVL